MIVSNKIKLFLGGAFLLAVLSAGLYMQSVIDSSAATIAKMERDYAESALKYQMKINQIEVDNLVLIQERSDELTSIRKEHETTISALNNDHSDRMRNMQKREQEYARIAQSNSAQCRDLANHTARLDRTLEEGRYLVAELRAGIEFRDNQLRTIGKLLTSERALLTE